MTTPPLYSKDLMTAPPETVVRARMGEGKYFRDVSFLVSEVSYLMARGDNHSSLALKIGKEIAFNIPLQELEDRIFRGKGVVDHVIDLRENVHGEWDNEFNKLAKKEETQGIINRPLKIAAFIRQAQQFNFMLHIFHESEVDWSRVVGENGKNGQCTHLPLKNTKGPFDETKMIIDIPRIRFMELYNEAKMKGLTELDLREMTRRKDPDRKPPPPSAPRPS